MKKDTTYTESFISKVISDGRITIPKNLRKEHSIKDGELVEVQFIRKIAPETPA